MTTATMHSIRPAADGDKAGAWRVASALVPAGVAELMVTREEWRELSRGRALLLQTIQILQEERGSADVRDLAQISGIGDEAVMASMIVSLSNENLAFVDGDEVRTGPAMAVDGDRARTIVERDVEVAVVGSPPLPCIGVDCARLKTLESYDMSSPSVSVADQALDR